MKRTMLSMKEVAQELGMSVQSIRGVYWRKDIPGYRIRKCCASIWTGSSENFRPKGCRGSYDHAALDRRRSRRRAQQYRPRLVKRGRKF